MLSETYDNKTLIETEATKYYDLVNEDLELLRYPDTENEINYSNFIEIVNQLNNKSIHFKYYEHYKQPIIFVLKNIILEGLTLLCKIIKIFNEHSDILRNDTHIYNTTITEFSKKVPCYEEYVRKLQGYVMIIERKINNSASFSEKNTLSENMKITDFKYDGGFKDNYNPILNLDQTILLTLISFNISICNLNDICGSKNNISELVKSSYNENNYKTFLDYIQFFNNDNYKTNGIDWKFIQNYFITNDIDLPSQENLNADKICCMSYLKERQKYVFIGGKQKTKNQKRKTKRMPQRKQSNKKIKNKLKKSQKNN